MNKREILMGHVVKALVDTIPNADSTHVISEATIPRNDYRMDDIYSVQFMMALESSFGRTVTLDENYFVPTEVIPREEMYQYKPISVLLDYLEKVVDLSKIVTKKDN